MWITISNIADKFKLKFKRLLYDLGPKVIVVGLTLEYSKTTTVSGVH